MRRYWLIIGVLCMLLLAAMGVCGEDAAVQGKEDEGVTCGELIKEMVKTLRMDLPEEVHSQPYADLPEEIAPYFKVASKKGLLADKDLDHPERIITRQEAFLFLSRTLEIKENYSEVLERFKDRDQIKEKAQKALGWAVAMGVIAGYPDETLKPEEELVRSEKEELLRRLSYLKRGQKFIDCISLAF